MAIRMSTRQIQNAMSAATRLVQRFNMSAIVIETAKTDHELLLSVSIAKSDVSDDGRLYIKALRKLRIIHEPVSMGFYTTFVKVNGVRYDPILPAFFLFLRWPAPSDKVDIIVEPTPCDLGSAE